MRPIPAKTIYIAPEVYGKDNCRARLERILPHVQCADIREYDDDARQACRQIGKRRHGKDDFGDDAVVIFTAFDPGRAGWYYHFRDGMDYLRRHGGVCQSALELNLVDGCVFRCAYCGFGRSIHFSLDVERFLDGLDDAFARYPHQALYKYSNMTDLPPFEPELDAVPPLVRRFAREQNRYLMLFTKCDNVDFLIPLDHLGHTIVSWSLSCDTASRLVDKRTASMHERIAAMQKVQAAGYPVRARLSPIVPIRNWQEEYDRLFQALLDRVTPDLITLELLGWFDFKDLSELFDPDLFDPDAYAAAKASAEELQGVLWGPFSHQTHEDIYRFCIQAVKRRAPQIPVAVCHGAPPIWKALGGLMGMQPDNYICNCGPTSAPGNPLYDLANAM